MAGYLAALEAEPFEQAEVKKAINIVSLLPDDRQASPGKGDTALQTGGYSRAELQFKDLTIIRVGSNSLFRFLAGTREATLEGGTILFSSPKGALVEERCKPGTLLRRLQDRTLWSRTSGGLK